MFKILFFALIGCVFGLNLSTLLELPAHDGVDRICQLKPENVTDLPNKLAEPGAKIILVNLTEDLIVKPERQQKFTQLLAQLLENEKVEVCVISVEKIDPVLIQVGFNEGGLYIVLNGKLHKYNGRMTVPAVLSYFQNLRESQVKIITGRLDKMAFDMIHNVPKVVGFFMNSTPELVAFEEAARHFATDIPFYAVLDRMVAKHLKLDTVGQIVLHKPLHKSPLPLLTNPAGLTDIVNFVESRRGQLFHHLTDSNINEIQDSLKEGLVVLAIGEQRHPTGGHFHRLITKVIRNTTDELNAYKMIWVDTEIFPATVMNNSVLRLQFGLPLDLPALGALDIIGNKSVWLSYRLLNQTLDKSSEEENLQIIKNWLFGVANNTIVPVGPSSNDGQRLLRPPLSQIVTSGSTFDLDCIVQNITGNCLWLRNGKTIGFNLDRYPYYSWIGDNLKGECSMRVTGATEGRDDGTWVCEVIGDMGNPTFTSPEAQIVIRNPNKLKNEL